MRVAYCSLEKWSTQIVGQALFQLVELPKVGRFWSGISYKNIFNNNNKKTAIYYILELFYQEGLQMVQGDEFNMQTTMLYYSPFNVFVCKTLFTPPECRSYL